MKIPIIPTPAISIRLKTSSIFTYFTIILVSYAFLTFTLTSMTFRRLRRTNCVVVKISKQHYALFPDPPSSPNHHHVFVRSFKCQENLDCALRGSISGGFFFLQRGNGRSVFEHNLWNIYLFNLSWQKTIPNLKKCQKY